VTVLYSLQIGSQLQGYANLQTETTLAITHHQEAACTSIQAIVEMKAVLASHVPAAGLAASAPHDDWPAPSNSAELRSSAGFEGAGARL
jgi:hypothetical protein